MGVMPNATIEYLVSHQGSTLNVSMSALHIYLLDLYQTLSKFHRVELEKL